jgi:hypothetical protein
VHVTRERRDVAGRNRRLYKAESKLRKHGHFAERPLERRLRLEEVDILEYGEGDLVVKFFMLQG